MWHDTSSAFRTISSLVGLVLVLAGSACAEPRVRPVEWAQPVIEAELDNFYRVSDVLYRAQQPDEQEIKELATMGIRSMLNLREYHDDNGVAAGAAMELLRVPMNAGEIDDAVVEQALDAIAGARKPILVHCWHGSDRTGAVVAMYRMVFQDWPRQRAIDEFVNGGFGYHKSVYPEIEHYLETVDIDRFKRRLALQGRTP